MPSQTNMGQQANAFYSNMNTIQNVNNQASNNDTSQSHVQQKMLNQQNANNSITSSSSSSSSSALATASNSQSSQPSGGSGSSNGAPPQIDAEETDKVVGYGAFGVVWSVTDPRSGRRVALKKMPNVFQTVVSAKRVFREVKMLCMLKHDNILHTVDVLQPPLIDLFHEVCFWL